MIAPGRLFLILILISLSPGSLAAGPLVVVAAPYLDVRTGPGRGFPVFHSVRRDEQLILHKRRTDWVKVSTTGNRQIDGWIHISQLGDTRTMTETLVNEDRRPRLEWSVSGGDFAGASAVSSSLAYRMTRHLSLRATGTQILGDFSNGWLATGTLRHHPFPGWRISPYFELGGGTLHTEPFATIVRASDRKDSVITVGAGTEFHLTSRFTAFLNYHRHTVLTSRDTNEEINEWKLGIKVAF